MFVKNNGYWYASYYCEGERMRYPTGIKVSSKSTADNLKKNKIERIITQYVANCEIAERSILKAELIAHLDHELGKKFKSKAEFWSDWDILISDMRSGAVLKKDGTKYREASAIHYENVRNALKRYEIATGYTFTYRFSIENYYALIAWLVIKNQSRNSIASVVKDLRAFLTRTHGKRHKNDIIYNKEFAYSGEESDTVALSVDEITALYNLELNGSKKKARDVIVIACWIALRAEDLGRINEYERRGKIIEVLTDKTGEKVVIPLHWMAIKIMDEYGLGNLPVYTTAEGLAYHLPELCKMAGIKSKHLISITKGGTRQAQYYEKWELVSPHTGRRSFATNMYMAGFPVKSIMKITGHRTESSFFRYIRIDKEENAETLAASPFFNEPGA
jgi:integrase